MAGAIESFLKVVMPKRFGAKGVSQTNTFSPDRTDQVLTAPTYREHLTDLFSTRQAENNQILLKSLFVHDPDVSAAVNAFLTVANTEPVFIVRDQEGNLDREGQKQLDNIIQLITSRFDYSKGFLYKPSLRAIAESMRYMILLRGGIMNELVFDKTGMPSEIRNVDLSTIKWYEKEPNKFIPEQEAPASSQKISLDVPTIFVSYFRRDPTDIYTHSPFVSAINTVAARQQVINDLYRIMQTTGFPRIEATVVEEIVRKNAPMDIQMDAARLRQYVNEEIARIQSTLSQTRADQALIHTDSIQMKVFNDKNPSNSLNIDSIISALNAMNQAGLRSMATILGRGESGVNTASVEARVFSMNAESLNEPIAEMFSQIFTMALRVTATSESKVICKFRPVELRPATELEPMLVLRAGRLKEDLSLGIIGDDEYHLEMYGRIRPDDAPELSGTGFLNPMPASNGEETNGAEKVSPNSDPLGRSLAPKGAGAARGGRKTPKSQPKPKE